MKIRKTATDFARNPICSQISQIDVPCICLCPPWTLPNHAPYRVRSLQHEIDHDREVDVDRLAVLQAWLVAPLLHGRDRGLVEAELRAGGAQHLDVPHRAVLLDHRLEDHLARDLGLAGDLGIGRLLLRGADQLRVGHAADPGVERLVQHAALDAAQHAAEDTPDDAAHDAADDTPLDAAFDAAVHAVILARVLLGGRDRDRLLLRHDLWLDDLDRLRD